jgi:hypothetical protein
MSPKETDGRHSDGSGEAERRDEARVKTKSNANGKPAGANSDAGEAMVIELNNIDSMFRQQELLAAAIARSRRRGRLEDKIQQLQSQIDNDLESEEPRKNEGRKRRRFQPSSDKEKRRVQGQQRQHDSESEWSKSESGESINVPRQVRGRDLSRKPAEEHGYTSRSAKRRARLAELELEMEAEKASLAQHQRRQHCAADGRQSQRHHQDRRGRDDRRGAHSDYLSESDGDKHGERRGRPRARQERGRGARTAYASESVGDEHGERRGRQRARQERGRVEARGRKRARSLCCYAGVLVEGMLPPPNPPPPPLVLG